MFGVSIMHFRVQKMHNQHSKVHINILNSWSGTKTKFHAKFRNKNNIYPKKIRNKLSCNMAEPTIRLNVPVL